MAEYFNRRREDQPPPVPEVLEARGTAGARPTAQDRGTAGARPTAQGPGIDLKLHELPGNLSNPLTEPPPSKKEYPSILRTLQKKLSPPDGSLENATTKWLDEVKALQDLRDRSSVARKSAPGERTLNTPDIKF